MLAVLEMVCNGCVIYFFLFSNQIDNSLLSEKYVQSYNFFMGFPNGGGEKNINIFNLSCGGCKKVGYCLLLLAKSK